MSKLSILSGRERDFEALFQFIKDELITIRLKWRVYCALYGTNPERVALLNSVSGTTSLIIQDALYDGVILHLCRLADPAKTRRNVNNSVDRLVTLMAPTGEFVRSKILADKYRTDCDPLKSLRNSHIAHSDHKASFDNDDKVGVSRRQINLAIDALREFVVFTGLEMFDTNYFTEVVSERANDEIAFLRALYYGQEKILALNMEVVRNAYTPHADPRDEPPEIKALCELHSKPEWLNYRPPERYD